MCEESSALILWVRKSGHPRALEPPYRGHLKACAKWSYVQESWRGYSPPTGFSASGSFWVTFSHLPVTSGKGSLVSTRWWRFYKGHHGTSLLLSGKKLLTDMPSQSILVLRISRDYTGLRGRIHLIGFERKHCLNPHSSIPILPHQLLSASPSDN